MSDQPQKTSFEDVAREYIGLMLAMKAARAAEADAKRQIEMLNEKLRANKAALGGCVGRNTPSRCAVADGNVVTVEFGENAQHRITVYGSDGRGLF